MPRKCNAADHLDGLPVHPSLFGLRDRANEAFEALRARPHETADGVRCTTEQALALGRDERRSKFPLPVLTVGGKRVWYEIVATRSEEAFGADVVWLDGDDTPERHEALAELSHDPAFVRAVIHRVAEDTFSRNEREDTRKFIQLGWGLLSCEDLRKAKAANPTDQRPLLTSYALRAFEALTGDHIESIQKRDAKAAASASLSVIKKKRRAKAAAPVLPPVASIIVPGHNAGPMRIHVNPAGVDAMLVYSTRWGGRAYTDPHKRPYDLELALGSARHNLTALLDTMTRP